MGTHLGAALTLAPEDTTSSDSAGCDHAHVEEASDHRENPEPTAATTEDKVILGQEVGPFYSGEFLMQIASIEIPVYCVKHCRMVETELQPEELFTEHLKSKEVIIHGFSE